VSCETDFDPNIYEESFPVVYGLPCPEDSHFQVLLTKSFIGPANARQLASEPQNLFYNNVEAYFELRRLDGSGIIRKELIWMDAMTQDDGFFNRTPNKVLGLTKDQFPINFEYNDYKPYGYLVLNIKIEDTNQDVYARSILIRKPDIFTPNPDRAPYPISLYSETPFEFSWYRDSVYYEASINFNYQLLTGDNWVDTVVTIKSQFPAKRHVQNEKIIIYLIGDQFMSKLANRITNSPDDVRRFVSIDFFAQSADPALQHYIENVRADLDIPLVPYSNIENGMGIFALTRKASAKGYTLDYKSLDSLAFGKYTKHLNFVRW
jgi:hypothetical protein